mgnify:CR=1 FL=1
MGCTTILVGKKASYDGSTMIARNDIPVPVIICQKNLWWFIRRNSRGNINL